MQRFLVSVSGKLEFMQKMRGVTAWKALVDRLNHDADREAEFHRIVTPFRERHLQRLFATWYKHAAPNARVHHILRGALQKLGAPIPRTKRQWFRSWASTSAKGVAKRDKMQRALRTFSPAGRMLARGFDAFAARAPRFEKSSEYAVICSGGSKILHMRGRQRDGAIGSPLICAGVYRFGFLVAGGTAGVVVGVTDASLRERTNDQNVWGLALSHGTLYTKTGVRARPVCRLRVA